MKIFVVIPNLNGQHYIRSCLNSLTKQTLIHDTLVVDNASSDNSIAVIESFGNVRIIIKQENEGFAGGVNAGIKLALSLGADYIALFNNDAVADKNWLSHLVSSLESNPKAGIATGTLLNEHGKRIDSTGEMLTSWGLPYPRGRGEQTSNKYDLLTNIFAASGGASLYRAKMLIEIGLFDEDFFAYYEDIDISFRAQLAGWEVVYQPKAIAYHQIGATSGKIKGFTTYQTMKNLPMLFWKNVPTSLAWRMFPRLFFAYWMMMLKTITVGPNRLAAIKGQIVWLKNIPITFKKRRQIQSTRKVTDEYIWGLITHDLPPNAHRLRTLRAKYRKLIGKNE